jgi:hypothetical protein
MDQYSLSGRRKLRKWREELLVVFYRQYSKTSYMM